MSRRPAGDIGCKALMRLSAHAACISNPWRPWLSGSVLMGVCQVGYYVSRQLLGPASRPSESPGVAGMALGTHRLEKKPTFGPAEKVSPPKVFWENFSSYFQAYKRQTIPYLSLGIPCSPPPPTPSYFLSPHIYHIYFCYQQWARSSQRSRPRRRPSR